MEQVVQEQGQIVTFIRQAVFTHVGTRGKKWQTDLVRPVKEADFVVCSGAEGAEEVIARNIKFMQEYCDNRHFGPNLTEGGSNVTELVPILIMSLAFDVYWYGSYCTFIYSLPWLSFERMLI